MKFDELLQITGEMPCFSAKFLTAAGDPRRINLQLSRWVKDGRVLRLRKGLYALANPYRKVTPEPFAIANQMRPACYVSLQSALSWHGIIPEFVATVTSVTTGRPQRFETPLGRFDFKHVKPDLFWGYRRFEMSHRQTAYVARPEKALLDLLYLTPGADRPGYLQELRLQNRQALHAETLAHDAKKSESKKLIRCATLLTAMIQESEGEPL
jgi:predicted transcriptional regulator of viral defense system